jgi:hypothetical protein
MESGERDMTRTPMRARLAAVLLVYLCGARYPANADRGVPLATEHYARAWQRVQKCSERLPIPGHDFSHLTMYAVPHLELDGHPIDGLWVEGDTVFLDESVSDTSWVVDHEMLHALLQGPTPEHGGPHPMDPFAFPCKLLGYQRTPGGIMGSYKR